MANKNKNVKRFSSKFVNANFRIKVFGRDENGKKINTLMGVSGIIRLIGEELFFKFVQRALDCMMDVCVCKLRRGLQVSLYLKLAMVISNELREALREAGFALMPINRDKLAIKDEPKYKLIKVEE